MFCTIIEHLNLQPRRALFWRAFTFLLQVSWPRDFGGGLQVSDSSRSANQADGRQPAEQRLRRPCSAHHLV